MALNYNFGIKCFFIDLDGTLLDDSHNTISSINLEAVRNFNSLPDHAVVISTGRVGESALTYMRETNTDYLIMGNGAMIVDKDENILRNNVLQDDVKEQVILFAQRHKLAFKVDGETVAYNCKTRKQRFILSRLHFDPTPEIPQISDFQHKIVLFGKTKSGMNKLVSQLNRLLLARATVVTSSRGYSIEITDVKATKGDAAFYVWSTIFGISSIKETAHIGDSMNDSTCKKKVGLLIALKSGSKQLMRIADIKGPKCKNFAVAKILKDNMPRQ